MDSVSRSPFNVQDKMSRISTETNENSQMDGNASYFTEEEAMSLLQHHQSHLERVRLENKELKQKMEEALDKKIEIDKQFSQAKSENAILKKETMHYQDLAKEWGEKWKQKETELATEEKSKIESYLSIVEFDTQHKCNEIIENNVNEASHKEQLLALLTSYQESKDSMKLLLSNYENIVKEHDSLQEQINDIIGSRETPKICIKCKENFLVGSNNENACVFHSGTLKYYSCRKCGADEYWSCCNQCRNCLRGCRKGKHISFQ